MDKTGNEKTAAEAESEAPTKAAEPALAPELATEELEKLKAKAAKAEENWDRYVRLTADFDNFKKRAARERQEAISFANENLLVKLLPVLDAFEMAMAATTTGAEGNQSLRTGVVMISSQLKSVLAEVGLEEIDANGKAFDPNFHEAISQQETSEVPEGQVVRQLRKGYKFRNRLMRAAGVVVAQKPSA